MPRRKKDEQPREPLKKIKTPSIVKGMKDVLLSDEKYWDFIETNARKLIRDYSFRKISTPIIEKFELFNHVLYKQNNLVSQEIFNFVDKGEKLALRPEATSSVARAYIEHNLVNSTPPLKIYYWGPMFRQGKVEPGKYRQFTQVGFEIIGDPSAAIDAELIIMAHFLLKNLGLSSEVSLSSNGCSLCRPEYKKNLSEYLKTKRAMLPVDVKKQITKEPMKIFDCNTVKCQKVIEDAPQVIDFLCDDCRNHLFKVLEYLDEIKVSYKLVPSLRRTYDYYSKTIFEIKTPADRKEDLVLAAGGRYDDLIEMIGGPSTPAAGFVFGVERLVNELKTCKIELPPEEKPDVFVAQLSEFARQKAFVFFEKLRQENFSVKANFSKASLKDQLDMAKKYGAKLVLILGQKEVMEETVILREQESGIQEVINFSRVVSEVKKRLKEMNK